MRRISLALISAAMLLGGCGSGLKAPDLFIVYRSGSVPHARLTLLVNEEGGVRCNGGPQLRIGNDQLVQARGITEELEKPSSEHLSLPAGRGSVLSYYVRDANGTVRFADDSQGQSKTMRELALFVLQTAQRVCRLPM
jgi:hypothetical protein